MIINCVNPVEKNLETLKQATGVSKKRMAAFGSELDRARMVQAICHVLNKKISPPISPSDIHNAYVIGPHNPDMILLFSAIEIQRPDGVVKLIDIASDAQLQAIAHRTVKGGDRTMGLAGRSDFHATIQGLAAMAYASVRAMNGLSQPALCAAVFSQDADQPNGRPMIFGPDGTSVLVAELPSMSKEEQAKWQKATHVEAHTKARINPPPGRDQHLR